MKCVVRLLWVRHHNSCSSLTHTQAYSSLPNSHTTDYAYEISSANVRIGKGVTREVGKDLVNRGVKRVLLFTDNNLMQHHPFSATEQSLRAENIQFDVYSDVRVEPTDRSMKSAIRRAQLGQYDAFLAVGGGSVMDTAKVARLFDRYPEKEFLDFVSQPIGKGESVTRDLKPLICIPTTSGTGSETSGVAIFDLESIKAKTGFFNRALSPTLAIVDPINAFSMPNNVAVYCGLDVLCNCLESYTLIPYHMRSPLPSNPRLRPAQQGSNPISDIWAIQVLKLLNGYFLPSVEGGGDEEASVQMSLASLLGGIGFGNAGVHLCHAISYAISGSVREFSSPGYPSDPLIPHGLSVIVSAPAVFKEVGRVAPDRCLQLASLLGVNTSNIKTKYAGECLSEYLCELMNRLNVPNGLSALGFTIDDIPMLVEKTLPHTRLLRLCPIQTTSSHLESIILNSMTLYN